MDIQKGDYVTRTSYNNDTVFKVINIKGNVCYLKGAEVRLYADSEINDLVKCEKPDEIKEETSDDSRKSTVSADTEYFFLPPKIIHIDGDSEFLGKCLKYYKKLGIYAIGKKIKEEDVPNQVKQLLENYKPGILIITGHDAFYKKKGDIHSLDNYKNSKNFIKAVQIARNIEPSHEKLVIIAGACQSNYEELIKAGANYASSPKRVNIHALDPAIIASTVALTERNKEINLKEMLKKTKYGSDGMGGIMGNGLMYVGYPR